MRYRSTPHRLVSSVQVAASLRRTGRKTAARTYDAMIAAVAIANDLTLYTATRTRTTLSASTSWTSSSLRKLMPTVTLGH
jgi:predicted nucleic acid-binding protein